VTCVLLTCIASNRFVTTGLWFLLHRLSLAGPLVTIGLGFLEPEPFKRASNM
jgi:hypothetical protein